MGIRRDRTKRERQSAIRLSLFCCPTTRCGGVAMSTPQKVTAGTAATVFIGSIVAANWLTTNYGFIPVGFGFTAAAGTFAAGAALAVRNVVQHAAGRLAVVAVILVGAAVSFGVSAPAIAIASAAAVLLSEMVDFAVYTPLARRAALGDRRWSLAAVAASLTGAVVDTAVFLGIAFGANAILPALPGQLWAKALTVAVVVAGVAVIRAVSRKPKYARRASSNAAR